MGEQANASKMGEKSEKSGKGKEDAKGHFVCEPRKQ
jgi:hypothetical protein